MDVDEPARDGRGRENTSSRARRLLPLVLATMASQALLVVLAPTIVEVGREFGASVGAVGQARSALAGAAIVTSLALAPFLDRLGIRPLLLWGAGLAVAGSAAAALSFSLAAFLTVHALIGVGFACLLSAGFAGVAAFPDEERAWAMGYVVGANALAWIVVNPIAGTLTGVLSWRVAHAVPAAIALCVFASAFASARAASGGSAAEAPGRGLGGVLAEPSARRWLLAEMIAFFAWGTQLTFVGAFFIERHGVGEPAAGLLLALGATIFFITSVRTAPLAGHLSRQRLVAASALALGAFIAVQFHAQTVVWIALAAFFASAVAGGVRTPVSSALGLSQLPDQPGSMMAARTAATMMGYLLGGLLGGATLAWGGYGALGLILAVCLALCAAHALRVSDPPAPKAAEPALTVASEVRL